MSIRNEFFHKMFDRYDKAIADGPIGDRHSCERCRSLRARLLKAFGKDEALELFRKYGELGSDFHSDLVGMAFYYEEMGEYEKAITTQEKLYELYMSEGYEYEAKISLDYIKELKNK